MPMNVAASDIEQDSLTLTWDGPTTETYRVIRDGVGVANGMSSPWIDTGLTPGTTYMYAVQGETAKGTVSASTAEPVSMWVSYGGQWVR